MGIDRAVLAISRTKQHMHTEFAYDEHMMEEDKEDLAETFMADEEESTEEDEEGDEIKKKEEEDEEESEDEI